MIQLLLVGFGALVMVSSVRAFMAANPSVSEDVRKAKTGVSSVGAAKTMGVVQLAIGAAMVIAGLTVNLWTPK